MIYKNLIFKKTLKARRTRIQKLIRCDSCHSYFEPMWHHDSSCTQGYRCAAYYVADKRYIYGSYGSCRFDFERVIVTGQVNFNDGDNICDECVTSLINNGLAHQQIDYNPKQEWLESIKDSDPELYALNISLSEAVNEYGFFDGIKIWEEENQLTNVDSHDID